MHFTIPQALFVSGMVAICVLAFPSLFWSGEATFISLSALTDLLALLLGYCATGLVVGAARAAGGRMWFSFLWGALAFGGFSLAFFIGSIAQYYMTISDDVLTILRAFIMMFGIVSLVLFSYWLYTVIAPQLLHWQQLWPSVLAMTGSLLLFLIPSESLYQTGPGFDWILLALCLFIAVGLLTTASRVLFYAGKGYQRFLITYLIGLSTFVCALALSLLVPLSVVWAGIPASTWVQVVYVIAMTFFFTSTLHLHQLEIYLVGERRSS